MRIGEKKWCLPAAGMLGSSLEHLITASSTGRYLTFFLMDWLSSLSGVILLLL
jgi:hypothetical protein